MKKTLLFLFWSVVVVGGMAGWGLIGKELAAPNERVVQVMVTEESFNHAHSLCLKYGKGEKILVGMETAKREGVTVPCRVVLNGEN